jgi:hypothetical protein
MEELADRLCLCLGERRMFSILREGGRLAFILGPKGCIESGFFFPKGQ